MRELEQEFVAP